MRPAAWGARPDSTLARATFLSVTAVAVSDVIHVGAVRDVGQTQGRDGARVLCVATSRRLRRYRRAARGPGCSHPPPSLAPPWVTLGVLWGHRVVGRVNPSGSCVVVFQSFCVSSLRHGAGLDVSARRHSAAARSGTARRASRGPGSYRPPHSPRAIALQPLPVSSTRWTVLVAEAPKQTPPPFSATATPPFTPTRR
jgi:hypothetical protein